MTNITNKIIDNTLKAFTVAIVSLLAISCTVTKSEAKVINKDPKTWSIYIQNTDTSYKHRTHYKEADTGEVIYCLDENLQPPDGHDMPEKGEADDVIYRIISNGYPYKSITGDANKDYVITQFAIWGYLGQLPDYSILTSNEPGIINHIKDLQNVGVTQTETDTVTVQFNKTNSVANYDGSNFVSEELELTSTGKYTANSFTISIDSSSPASIVDTSGNKIDKVSIGQKFKVLIPRGSKSGTATLTATGTVTQPKATEFESKWPDIQNVVGIIEKPVPTTSINKAAITWSGEGDIEIVKKDSETGKLLEGATFEIINEAGHSVERLTTDENGKLKTSKLPYGDYKIKEVQSPTGYHLDSSEFSVTISATNKVIQVERVNNPIKGSIELLKISSLDNTTTLEGAVFEIYDSLGNLVDTQTSNSNGLLKFENLRYGKYTIKEVQSPDGHTLLEEPIEVEINDANNTIYKTVTNKLIEGELDFSKTELTSGEIIEGAYIQIIGIDKFNSHVNFEFISSKDGNRFKLPYGKYEFRETLPPEGYLLSTEVGTFEIKEDGTIVKAELKNQRIHGNIKLIKISSLNDKTKLEGAVFEIYDEKGNLVDTQTSNKDGEVNFEKLPYGKYKIKEVKAPEGHILSDKEIDVFVQKDSETINITATNTLIEGEVDFSKTDLVTGEIIEGAKIEIIGKDKFNNHIKLEFTSSKDGNRFKLPYGKYEFRETIAPDGYVLSTEVAEFEIKENGEVIKAELKNAPILGKVIIKKIDAQNKDKELAGAEFEIYNSKGELVDTQVSNKKGLVEFKNLRYGEYTIKESKAPKGYTKTSEEFKISISENGQVIELDITNQANLVKTGGEFNHRSYILGGSIIVIGCALVFLKKRRY